MQLKCRSASVVHKSGHLSRHFTLPIPLESNRENFAGDLIHCLMLFIWQSFILQKRFALSSTSPSPLDAKSGLALSSRIAPYNQLAAFFSLSIHFSNPVFATSSICYPPSRSNRPSTFSEVFCTRLQLNLCPIWQTKVNYLKSPTRCYLPITWSPHSEKNK